MPPSPHLIRVNVLIRYLGVPLPGSLPVGDRDLVPCGQARTAFFWFRRQPCLIPHCWTAWQGLLI